jgi:hypothetical protein
MTVSQDRWTCPQCVPGHGTVVVIGSQADVKCCIEAVQRRHSEAHRAAAAVVARLGFPNALRPARRTA